MISKGCEGFVDVRFSVVVTFLPFSHIGYSRPNCPLTFFSASSMRARFSGFLKSIKGSFVNSETWTTCSPVPMPASPPPSIHTAYMPPQTPHHLPACAPTPPPLYPPNSPPPLR